MNLFEKRAAAQREGGLLMLFSLVEDGTLDISVAAGKAGMGEETFLLKMKEAGFSLAEDAVRTETGAQNESADSVENPVVEELPASDEIKPAAEEEPAIIAEITSAAEEEPVITAGIVPAAEEEPAADDFTADSYSEIGEVEESTFPEDTKEYSEIAVVLPVEEKRTYGPEDVGLVLAGGGGKGAYQIGVLRALAEEGQLDKVVAVSGTSIGAVNAVLYAQGDFDRAYQTWDDIDMGVLFDFDPAMLAQGKIYFSRDEMNRLFNKYVDYSLLEKSNLEIYCGVAEETESGYRAEYMKLNGKSMNEIRSILTASTAMPIVYDTVVIDGKHYRDGGVVDNEPVRPLYDLGIRKFILINLDYAKPFRTEQFPEAEFIVIEPSRDLGDIFSGTLNFSTDEKTIKRTLGYKDGKRAIKVLIEKDPAYIAMAPALAIRDYEETVREHDRQKRVSALEQSVSSSLDYIAELEKKYQ